MTAIVAAETDTHVYLAADRRIIDDSDGQIFQSAVPKIINPCEGLYIASAGRLWHTHYFKQVNIKTEDPIIWLKQASIAYYEWLIEKDIPKDTDDSVAICSEGIYGFDSEGLLIKFEGTFTAGTGGPAVAGALALLHQILNKPISKSTIMMALEASALTNASVGGPFDIFTIKK